MHRLSQPVKEGVILMIDWFRGEIFFLHAPLPAGRVMSILPDGELEWETVKSVQLRGSHESSLKIKSSGGDGQGNATTLLIDGNLSKFLQGHNIFGSLDMNLLLHKALSKVFSEHKEHFKLSSPDFALAKVKKGDYLVKMLDVNFLFDVGNDESVEAWLHAAEMNARTRSGRSCRDKGTVYLQKSSRRWAFKFYNKYREINSRSKKHQLHDDLKNKGLEDFIKGKIRAELRLMSLELKQNGLTHGYHFTQEKLIELFNHYLGRINMNNQATLIDEKLFKLPCKLQGTYQLWRQGASLKDMMPKATFYRHRKQLLEHGVDITFPPTHLSHSNNVIPLMRVIEAKPVSVPAWAYEQNLIAA